MRSLYYTFNLTRQYLQKKFGGRSWPFDPPVMALQFASFWHWKIIVCIAVRSQLKPDFWVPAHTVHAPIHRVHSVHNSRVLYHSLCMQHVAGASETDLREDSAGNYPNDWVFIAIVALHCGERATPSNSPDIGIIMCVCTTCAR